MRESEDDKARGTEEFCGTMLLAHQKKCHKMFRGMADGELLYISVERNASERILEDAQFIRISLLTDEIIGYDFEMFGTENRIVRLNEYRPYFVSFIVPLEENRLGDIEVLGDGWHIGRFIGPKQMIANEGIVLNGILETSASPVNYLDRRLLVFTNSSLSKSVLNHINHTYDPYHFSCSKSFDIEKILNNVWGRDVPKTIDIYNVGHGNADYIRGFGNRILYDIGYNYRSFPKQYKPKYLRAVYAIRKLKPGCVILSHWDLDHIIGCAYADSHIFRKKWIAPSLVTSKDKKATPNSVRLANYLEALGSLHLVDREQKNKRIATIWCTGDIKMKLWLGSGSSRLNMKNREGLILEIVDKKGKYPHIILAGDVPYRCMPDILEYSPDFLHVPHHCSNMELDRLKSMSGEGKCAVISTNRKKKGKLNYDATHHSELTNKFFSVVNTIDSEFGDEANLSVQIDYNKGDFHFR